MVGHLASSLGSRMAYAAVLWHVYELTASPILLGSVGITQLLPVLIIGPLGGVLADRFDRRTLLLWTQLVQAVPTALLGVLTLTDTLTAWHLFGLVLCVSFAESIDTAARKALIPSITPTEHLGGAMALADMVKNGAKLAGPALMGFVAAMASIGLVYLLNAVSFVLMAGVLTTLHRSSQRTSTDPSRPIAPLQALRQAARFIRHTPMVWGLLVLDFVATLFASAVDLLPMYATEVLHLDVGEYGLLASGVAVGALSASAVMVRMPIPRVPGRTCVGAGLLFGMGATALGLVDQFWPAFACLAVLGAADTVGTVVRNTVRELITPDELRGRVGALASLVTKSGPRVGEWEAGVVAAIWGVQASMLTGGVLCIVGVAAIGLGLPVLRKPVKLDPVTERTS
jgi:MFS family permease